MLIENNDEEEVKNKDNSKTNKKQIYIPEKIISKIQKEKQYKDKLNYAEIIRNKYILSDPNEQKEQYDKNNKTNRNNKSVNNNIRELPKIPLFNKNEKKVLANILPEKEIKKYEKRFEYID